MDLGKIPPMRTDAISIGKNPPDDVNVILEVAVGALIMEDTAGQDEKVVAVPSHALTRRYDHVQTASEPRAEGAPRARPVF